MPLRVWEAANAPSAEEYQAVVKAVAAVIGLYGMLIGKALIIPVGPSYEIGRNLPRIEGVPDIVEGLGRSIRLRLFSLRT